MAAPGLWPRLVQLVGTACLLVVFHATFYWEWIKTYSLDEGGYFGFLGWAIEALVGSFVFDLTQASAGATLSSVVGASLLDFALLGAVGGKERCGANRCNW